MAVVAAALAFVILRGGYALEQRLGVKHEEPPGRLQRESDEQPRD